MNCPKDPNAKTGADSKAEMERLEALKKSKTTNALSVESTQKIYENLMSRGALAFVNETLSGEREESEDEGNEDRPAEDIAKYFFTDIMEMKREIEFDVQKVGNR